MNKRTITVDQLIREEYLKLQKEKYIKNLVNEVISEIQEQQLQKPKPILGGTVKEYLVPILKDAGYSVDYDAKQNFPTIGSADPLSTTGIVKPTFKKSFSGLRFKDIDIGDGTIQNLMIGIAFGNTKQLVTKDTDGNVQRITIVTKNVSFDITNLPKSLNSIAGKKPPFSEKELKNQYILDPNGTFAAIDIQVVNPSVTSDREINRMSFTTGAPGFLSYETRTTKKAFGVDGIVTFTNVVKAQDGPYEVSINIQGQLIPIRAVEDKTSTDQATDSLLLSIEKDFPALDSIKDKKFVPMTTSGETTTPDAVLQMLSEEQIKQMLEVKKELDENELYVEVISKFVQNKYEWLKAYIPTAIMKTADFVVWFFCWITINNPVSQLVMEPSLDNFQNLLNWIGFVDIFFIGTIADGINAVISLCRYAATGNDRYLVDAAISAFAMIPFYGMAGNFSNLFKPVSRSRAVKKVLKRSDEISKVAAKLSKSKLWKKYMVALIKGDISGMAKVLRRMEKQGILTREQLAYMSGPDGVKVLSMYINSGKKNLMDFQKYLNKLNSKLPSKSKIDIEWAIGHFDDASKYAEAMTQSFQLAYNNALRPNLIQRATGVIIKGSVKTGGKVVKVSASGVKLAARFTGLTILLGNYKFAFAAAALKVILKNTKFGKLFNRKKLVDMGKDSAEFLRKMWYQDLWGNPGKLAIAFNNTFQLNIKHINQYIKKSGKTALGIGIDDPKSSLSFLKMFNQITGKQFKNVNKISKAEMSAFLVTLKNGAFKTKGVGKKAQKAFYKEIAEVVAATSADNTSKLWINFQRDGLKNILNGKLTKYWTREAVQQQGYLSLINGIYSIKFADIAFDEVNAFFEANGMGWGADPSDAEKEEACRVTVGVFFKLIYDAAENFEIPFEDNLRSFKNYIVESTTPYWHSIAINSEVATDVIENGFDNMTSETKNNLKNKIESYPGLRGDINSSTGRLVAPAYVLVGGKRILNPMVRPVYNGPGNINLEKQADEGVMEPIGDQWHTGDGKTGRPVKYWKAGDAGIPVFMLAKIRNYSEETPADQINIPLTPRQKISIDAQIANYKRMQALEELGLSSEEEAPQVYTWIPGPPTAEDIIAYTEARSSEDSNAGLIKTIMKEIGGQFDKLIDAPTEEKGNTNEQWPAGPYGKEHDYSDYGGPFGDRKHKTDFKKGPGKTPTKSIGHGRGEEEAEDDRITGYRLVSEDPKKGTGKKPKGSGRRLYTDENPKDTVSVKFKTRQDVVDTLTKASFKSKSHKRQSQIINLIHQRLRVAVERTKDPAKKKRLKAAYDYIKKKKEASKEKTKRLKNELKGFSPSGSGSRYRAIEKRGDKYYFRQDSPFRKGIKQEFGPYDTKAAALKKMNSYPPAVNYRDISDGVEENFADGKNPGRKGLSQRVGIPKNATIAQLEKAAKSKGEKGRLARWQLNMRRGKKKK